MSDKDHFKSEMRELGRQIDCLRMLGSINIEPFKSMHRELKEELNRRAKFEDLLVHHQEQERIDELNKQAMDALPKTKQEFIEYLKGEGYHKVFGGVILKKPKSIGGEWINTKTEAVINFPDENWQRYIFGFLPYTKMPAND